jgi:hypothetical protein
VNLGNYLLRKTAKKTAESISKYVSSGTFDTDVGALKAWASTQRNSERLVIMIDSLDSLGIRYDKESIVGTAHIAKTLFYAEMDIDEYSLSEKVRDDIKKIFTDLL